MTGKRREKAGTRSKITASDIWHLIDGSVMDTGSPTGGVTRYSEDDLARKRRAHKFFYWRWDPFFVICFCGTALFFYLMLLLLLLFAAFSLVKDAATAQTAANVAALALAPPLAILLANTLFYFLRDVRILGEKKYGWPLAIGISAALAVMAFRGDIPWRAVIGGGAVLAGIVILFLNVVDWILRKIFHREILFLHERPDEKRKREH